ncbi:hypothetical protein C0J52_06596 [Blattella germanica]|nr:hypothetical protein C0J52_06596 [Blattella germanica]
MIRWLDGDLPCVRVLHLEMFPSTILEVYILGNVLLHLPAANPILLVEQQAIQLTDILHPHLISRCHILPRADSAVEQIAKIQE